MRGEAKHQHAHLGTLWFGSSHQAPIMCSNGHVNGVRWGEGGYEVPNTINMPIGACYWCSMEWEGGCQLPITCPIGHFGGVRRRGNATRHENMSICGHVFVSSWRVGWGWRRTTRTRKTRPIRRIFRARGVKWGAGEWLGREGGC